MHSVQIKRQKGLNESQISSFMSTFQNPVTNVYLSKRTKRTLKEQTFLF
jgi:hypothetical protein